MKNKFAIVLMFIAAILYTQVNAADLQLKNGTVLKDVAISREAGLFKIRHTSGIGHYNLDEFVPDDQERLNLTAFVSDDLTRHMQKVNPDVPVSQPASNLLVDTLKKMSGQIITDLQVKGIKRLAVSKIYYNGSGINPVAQYVQRKLMGEMLNQATESLVILEREDVRLLIEENKIQFMIGKGTENVADKSESLLMGEFLYDKAFRQAILSIRVIDSKSTAIISAVASVVDIDPDLSDRLGIPYSVLPRDSLYQIQPSIASNSRLIKKLKDCGKLSLSPASAVPLEYQFAVRVLHVFVVTELVNSGVTALERELLYQIADERALVKESLDSVIPGESILQIILDKSASANTPNFFLKVTRRAGGALLAQVEVGLKTPVAPTIIRTMPNSTISRLGADDSFKAAVVAYQEASSITEHETLRFEETIAMSDRMSWPKDKISTLFNKKIFTWRFDNGMELDEYWYRCEFTKWPSINGQQMFKEVLQQIIPHENGNDDALKASLVAISVSGYNHPVWGNSVPYIGPLNIIYGQISSLYTVKRNREPCAEYWHACLSSFVKKQFTSMHPTLFSSDGSRINPYRGSFTWNGECSQKHDPFSDWDSSISSDIQFNYAIDITWEGIYPTATAVTIDLSPMKTRLYKVK